MFQKYQSLPRIVEAVQFTAVNKDRVFNSLIGSFEAEFENDNPILKVTTIHGETAIVRLGDWIVKDATPGTYYPVKNEIFCSHYVWEEKLTEDLKPCPFCGGKAVVDEFQISHVSDKDYWVECADGGCVVCPETDNFSTPEQAAAAWNKRQLFKDILSYRDGE